MLGLVLMPFAAVLFIKLLDRFTRFETAAYLLVTVIGLKLVADWALNRVVSAAQLDRMSDRELAAASREMSVYARVNPQHKLRIVNALQSNGEIVAMTGDGVNHAPALKAADIGVAMGITGTDVSKEVADLVLTDDNFATIVAAVEEGRTVFDNIRKFLCYLLSSNAGEVLTVFFSVVLAGPLGLDHHGILVLPLPATQTLWINLLTDGAPALALGVDPPDPDLMSHSPRPHGEGVIDRRMRVDIALVGIVMAAGTLLIFDAALPGGFIEGGRRNGIRSDNGIYDVDALSTVQCLQRPIGGAQRLPGPVP